MYPGFGGCAACQGLSGGIPGEDDFLPRYRQVGQEAPDRYTTMTFGHVALAGAAGIFLGMLFMYAYSERKRRR